MSTLATLIFFPILFNPRLFYRDKRDASSSIPRDYRVTYVVHTNVKLPEDKIDKVMEDRMKSKNDSCQENNLGTYSINIRNEPTKFSEYKITKLRVP